MNVIDNRITFVLDNVSGYQTIADEASLNSSVFVLDSTKDVLSQIAAITAQYSSLDSIHLFSHGSSGSLDLGNITLDSQTLQNYHEILAQIGTSLSDNGDILLYGCNVAEGQSGVEFINKLSQATGADIAASDDLTGNSAKGGNWILEALSGNIEAQAISIDGFSGVLAGYTQVYFTQTNETNNGIITSGNWGSSSISDITINFLAPAGGIDSIGSTLIGEGIGLTSSTSGGIASQNLDTFFLYNGSTSFDISQFKVYNNTASDVTLTISGYSDFAWNQEYGAQIDNSAIQTTGTATANSWTTIDLDDFSNLESVVVDFTDNTALFFNDFYIQKHIPNQAPAFGNIDGDSHSSYNICRCFRKCHYYRRRR